MPPTQQQLQDFDQTFWYHTGVLVSQSRLYLLTGEVQAADTESYAAADALFEMLLVRLRTLDSFYRTTNPGGDDAAACQFAPLWASVGFLTSQERQGVNKRLAHLTYGQPAFHEWPIGQMVHRGLETTLGFLAQVPQPLSALWAYRQSEIDRFLTGDFVTYMLDEIWTETDRHAHRRLTP